MNYIESFKLVDSETQMDKDRDCEYEIYGLANSWGGVIFERDINNLNQILYHVSNGVKVVETYLDKHDYFFRKGDDNFFMHYRNCEDYNYSKDKTELTIENIIKTVKEYVYLHQPNLMTRTCMGWGDKSSVLTDPNHCGAKIVLDDKEEYLIYKSYGKVKISRNTENSESESKNPAELIAEFDLDEEMYGKALDFKYIKTKIYRGFYGKLSDDKLQQYLQNKKELEEFIENN